jgi:tagatose-6-phosphate ketose/aldose isomerase
MLSRYFRLRQRSLSRSRIGIPEPGGGVLSHPHRDGGRGPADGAEPKVSGELEAWLARFRTLPAFSALLAAPWEEQLERGYGHTLREICQQPLTWPRTAAAMRGAEDRLRRVLVAGGIADRSGSLVLTGSGSSFFVCECAAGPLQESLGVAVRALPAGLLLTHPGESLPPPPARYVAVSLARSGDSPESGAVVHRVAKDERAVQLLVSCNRDGALATRFRSTPRVESILLPPETNDQSLVMTSSFTNLVLAALALGGADAGYSETAHRLAAAGRSLLEERAADIAVLARQPYSGVVYLGSGSRLGAAHESALKMLESNGGRVATMAESFLGLRHGPMAAVAEDSLIVAFLSSDPVVRAFERDVLVELRRKGLGRWRLIVGEHIPADLAAGPEDVLVDVSKDVRVDVSEDVRRDVFEDVRKDVSEDVRKDVVGRPGPSLGDGALSLLDVVAGQLLAFFRCLHGGGRPDRPSTGIIQRVVESFAIHAG